MSRRIAVTSIAAVVIAAGMGFSLASVHAVGTGAPVAVGAAPVKVIHAVAASRYWWQQDGPACIPMSARVVIGVETGNVISATDIRATAARVAGFDQDGTDWATTPNILAAYGVTSHTVSGASLDTLRASLDSGHAPMVVIDPTNVWAAFGLEGTPGEEHAVVIQSISDVDHTVTLVDSAWSGGMSETIATPIFISAWQALGDAALLVG